MARGARELASGLEPADRFRAAGGGRKPLRDSDPGLVAALLALVEPDQRGDPQSPLRWTVKSTRNLAAELTRQGHRVGPDTVAALLKAEGLSLQGTSRTTGGARHPDRDAQFSYINSQVKEFIAAEQPVISVDTKKKEVLGDYSVGGREWHCAGEPVRVRAHDFPEKDAQKAVPYGIYDLAADTGWVSVCCDRDTAAFAVATLRRATRLLITADAGGANGYREEGQGGGLLPPPRRSARHAPHAHPPRDHVVPLGHPPHHPPPQVTPTAGRSKAVRRHADAAKVRAMPRRRPPSPAE